MSRYYPSASILHDPGKVRILSRFKRYSGIGFLVAVGYMDPGNWATDIESGSRFGYALICVVLAASLVAMFLQTLCVRLGIASGKDLAELCREQFRHEVNLFLWLLAEIAIIACDFAEVLGTALALKLLFGIPLLIGILITGLDTLLIFAMRDNKRLSLRKLVVVLVTIITICFAAEIILSQPQWHLVAAGFVPDLKIFRLPEAWLLAIGIFGATVMPHNLYLHSNIVKRYPAVEHESKGRSIKILTTDTLITLGIAFFVNAAILVMAASAFHFTGRGQVTDIEQAYHMLAPTLGTVAASVILAVALLASGQSSTFTGTLAGQVIFEGFLKLKIPKWQQRLITRILAIIPAWLLVATYGEHSLGHLLVISQVILSLQLPFAIIPLLMFSADHELMGKWRLPSFWLVISWLTTAGLMAANIYLLYKLFVAD